MLIEQVTINEFIERYSSIENVESLKNLTRDFTNELLEKIIKVHKRDIAYLNNRVSSDFRRGSKSPLKKLHDNHSKKITADLKFIEKIFLKLVLDSIKPLSKSNELPQDVICQIKIDSDKTKKILEILIEMSGEFTDHNNTTQLCIKYTLPIYQALNSEKDKIVTAFRDIIIINQ